MGADAGAPSGIEADLPAAERLLGLSYTPRQRRQLARGYPAVLKELGGVRTLSLPNEISPAARFDPRIPGKTCRMPRAGVRGRAPAAGALPSSPTDVALAPAWKQAAWLRAGKISSIELTHLYLDRIVATHASGHPCLVMKAGFLELPTRTIDNEPVDAHGAKHRVPRAICLWSALFREDVLITLGRALEAVLGVADQNPPLALR